MQCSAIFYFKDMSQPTTIKNELFRFVTVKSIMDIPESSANNNVITAPQTAIDELPASQSAAKSAFETYVKPFATAKEVRAVSMQICMILRLLFTQNENVMWHLYWKNRT